MHEPELAHGILQEMYAGSSLAYEPGPRMAADEVGVHTPKWPSPDGDLTRDKFCGLTVKVDEKLECKQLGEQTTDDKLAFWKNINVFKMRAENEFRRMETIASAYGFELIRKSDLVQMLANVLNSREGQQGNRKRNPSTELAGGDPKRIRTQSPGQRKKRSVDTTSEQNVTTHALRIVDKDSSSDFTLKDCRIWEKSDEGEVIETHVYDFETNTFIEDSKTDSGSSLAATFTNEDGIEVDANEPDPEPSAEVPRVRTISIVLRPRYD